MSRATPAPNNEVKTISLAKPRIREMKVQKLTIPELASNFIELDLLFESIFSDFRFNPLLGSQILNLEKQNLYSTLDLLVLVRPGKHVLNERHIFGNGLLLCSYPLIDLD